MSHVKVAMRVKPVSSAAPSDYMMTILDPPTLILKRLKESKGCSKANADDFANGMYQFVFTSIMEDSTNEQVFAEAAKSVVDSVMEGYNGTIMAYGQTGSGKTFTMLGPENTPLDDPDKQGVIPRALHTLFVDVRKRSEVASSTVYMSYYELYMETFVDLLQPASVAAKLKHEVSITNGNVTLSNMTPVEVSTFSEALRLVEKAQARRAVGSTKMNERSSRSHTILSVILETITTDGMKRRGKLNLVDLAGSESLKKTQAVGQRKAEGKEINKSLLQLRNVITALADKASHIPYRNSNLTRVLQDSLGGNCKTTLIACIWGDEVQANETVSTCQFAQNMMKVEQNAKQNKDFVAGPGNVMHLSPAVQKIMNSMIEMRLAQAARMQSKGGQGMSEEDKAEIARNEATIQSLNEEVKRVKLQEEAKALEFAKERERLRLELDAERAQLEVHRRELEEEKAKGLAKLQAEEQDKENQRLKQLLEEHQRLLREKEEQLKLQSELNSESIMSATPQFKVQIENQEELMQRLKDYSDLQKVLKGKIADGTITAEEEEEELYLRDEINAMRAQLGVGLSPNRADRSDQDSVSFVNDRPLYDTDSEYVTDLSSPQSRTDVCSPRSGFGSPGEHHRHSTGGFMRESQSYISRRASSHSVGGGLSSRWPPVDDDDPNFAPANLKKPSFVKRIFSGGRRQQAPSALTANNINALQGRSKAADSIVILNRLDHDQYLEEVKWDATTDFEGAELTLEGMKRYLPSVMARSRQ